MSEAVWLALLAKMVATGLIVVAASVVAERAGPLFGGLIASLPVAAGPGYVFLAFDASPDFIAASALMSLVANAAMPPFLLVLTRLAPRCAAPMALGAGLLAWLALVLALRPWEWSWVGAVLANLFSFAACGALLRLPTVGPLPKLRRHWSELPLRALLVGGVVAIVVTLAQGLGPRFSGIGVVFPVAFSSLAFILHVRLGGKVAAVTLGGALLPMLGFAGALLTVHLTALPAGVWPSLGLALLVSLAWSALLLLRSRIAA